MKPNRIDSSDPKARAVTAAIQSGDMSELRRQLDTDPRLAKACITGPVAGGQASSEARSLLHIATDWPGHFPNAAESVQLLVARGADVNARFEGPHQETPLHWAASCDDVAVLDALLDLGADIDAPGAVIAGGTPLSDAVAFGQWNAARRLIERGAKSSLWESAALGLLERVAHFFEDSANAPDRTAVTNALWCACHGGQQETAAHLLQRGANLNWVGHDGLTPMDAALRSGATKLADWLKARGARPAREVAPDDRHGRPT